VLGMMMMTGKAGVELDSLQVLELDKDGMELA
jgi:hypothetical protein